jgi:hypothetical protein
MPHIEEVMEIDLVSIHYKSDFSNVFNMRTFSWGTHASLRALQVFLALLLSQISSSDGKSKPFGITFVKPSTSPK